ncbi:MAG: ribosomal L7Ae/L30e/S12e/Gadd45 family protein [Clostridiaceae bacterium]
MNKFLQFLGICKKSGRITEGYNKCEEAVKNKKLFLIIVSMEASENTKRKFANYCLKYDVPLISGISKESLGKHTGLDEINVLGISDCRMAEQLIKIWQKIE